MEILVGKILKHIRIFNKLKQNELSEMLGISKSYISEIESCKKIPTIEVLQKYSDTFNISLSTILLFTENIDNPKNIATKFLCKKAVQFLDWLVKNSKYDE